MGSIPGVRSVAGALASAGNTGVLSSVDWKCSISKFLKTGV